MLHPIILNEIAKARQRDWLKEADENRRARQVRRSRLADALLPLAPRPEPLTTCCEQGCA